MNSLVKLYLETKAKDFFDPIEIIKLRSMA